MARGYRQAVGTRSAGTVGQGGGGRAGGGRSVMASDPRAMRELASLTQDSKNSRIKTPQDALDAIQSQMMPMHEAITIAHNLKLIDDPNTTTAQEAIEALMDANAERRGGAGGGNRNGQSRPRTRYRKDEEDDDWWIDEAEAIAEQHQSRRGNVKVRQRRTGKPDFEEFEREREARRERVIQVKSDLNQQRRISSMLLTSSTSPGPQNYTPQSPTGNHAHPLEGTGDTDDNLVEKRHRKPEHGRAQTNPGHSPSDFEDNDGHFGQDLAGSEHQASYYLSPEEEVMRLRGQLRDAEQKLSKKMILDKLDELELTPITAGKINDFIEEIKKSEDPDPIIEMTTADITEDSVSGYLDDRGLDDNQD